MVDASIIMVENAHKKLEEWEARGGGQDRLEVIIEAAKEVGPSLFFSLLVITVGFLPVFTLQAQAGRLFKAPRLHEDLCHALLVFPGRNA